MFILFQGLPVQFIQTTLPYAGEKGEQVIKEMKKHIKKLEHHKFETRFAYKAKRLASRFQLKDQVNGRDKNSHVLKHTIESGHSPIEMNKVKIINKNFPNYYKRKVSEAIYIKKKKPPLNVQDMSVPLKLLS